MPSKKKSSGGRKRSRSEEKGQADSGSQQPSPRGGPPAASVRLPEVVLDWSAEPNRDAVTARDLRQLILWSVPSPIPLVPSPTLLQLRQKSGQSAARVVIVVVEGWSKDVLAPTVVKPSTEQVKEEAERTAAVVRRDWVARQMLSELRSSRCWAHQPRTVSSAAVASSLMMINESGSSMSASAAAAAASAVQCATLVVPAPRLSFEKDLFWMTGGGGGGAQHSSGGGGSTKSVAKAFEKAMEIHHQSATTAAGAPGEPTELLPPSAKEETSQQLNNNQSHQVKEGKHQQQQLRSGTTKEEEEAALEEDDPSHVWRDRKRLLTHALKLPQHQAEVEALGFVVTPPATVAVGEWCSFPDREEHEDKEDGSQPQSSSGFCRAVAMDCEMVLVDGRISALARITLLNAETGDLLLDRLVKPEQPIVDYVTRYSGIDEEMLRDVTYTLAECQSDMKRLISQATFLVGHSLENDLKATQFIPNCYLLDSSWLFPHPSGLPFKNALKFLMQRYFNKKIQTGMHDSTEDAWCSAELVRLKLQRGPTFGIPQRHSIFKRIAEDKSAGVVRFSFFDHVEGLRELCPAGVGAADLVVVRNDDDAVKKVLRAIQREREESETAEAEGSEGEAEKAAAAARRSFSLMWVRLQENLCPPSSAEGDAADDGEVGEASLRAQWQSRVQATNGRVMKMVEACADGTLILVLGTPAPPPPLSGAGSSLGNWSRNQKGICFAFVKDGSAVGPPQGEDEEEGSGREPEAIGSINPPACQPQ